MYKTWIIFKKVGWFKWEFVKYFPDINRMFIYQDDVQTELIRLSESDNMKQYKACRLGEDSFLRTKVKKVLKPYVGVIKEIIVEPSI